MSLHFHRELEQIKKKALYLCALTEQSVQNAVVSVQKRDVELARATRERDAEIDEMEVEIEEDCLKILALYQPVAIDLRFLIAIAKIGHEMERVADLAVDIAKLAIAIAGRDPIETPYDVVAMGRRAQDMLKRAIDALINLDGALAREVWAEDDVIDQMNDDNYRQTLNLIRAQPGQLETWIDFLTVSRRLERLADHITNIAKDVIYLNEGEIARHRAKRFLKKSTGDGPIPRA